MTDHEIAAIATTGVISIAWVIQTARLRLAQRRIEELLREGTEDGGEPEKVRIRVGCKDWSGEYRQKQWDALVRIARAGKKLRALPHGTMRPDHWDLVKGMDDALDAIELEEPS